jgi:hypothetical protein
VIPRGPGYIVDFFRTIGSAATPQYFGTLWNPAGSGKVVVVRAVQVQIPATTTPGTLCRLYRITVQPTAGTAITPSKQDTESDASVVEAIGGTASDGGALTPITTAVPATSPLGTTIAQSNATTGQVSGAVDITRSYADEEAIVLRPGEGLLIVNNGAALAATGQNYFRGRVYFEEYDS